MIKTVVFDFADTIARLEPSKEKIMKQYLKERLSITISMEKIAQAYFYLQNFSFYSSVKIVTPEQKKEFYREYNKKIFSTLGILHHVEPFLDDFFAYFIECNKHWVIKPEALDLLQYLKSKKIQIGLISNFDTVLYDILEKNLQIKEFFSYIHISQEIGLEKPDIGFYKNFLEKYELNQQTILYVGDNYQLDFLPTYELGFKSLLLDEEQHYTSLPNLPRISSLHEIKALLIDNEDHHK